MKRTWAEHDWSLLRLRWRLPLGPDTSRLRLSDFKAVAQDLLGDVRAATATSSELRQRKRFTGSPWPRGAHAAQLGPNPRRRPASGWWWLVVVVGAAWSWREWG
eukprot:13708687-Alexandrium_andersonii.AAC.1